MPDLILANTRSRVASILTRTCLQLLCGWAAFTQYAVAQPELDFSADGFRWVEFEVSIFRNLFASDSSSEVSNRDKLHLDYQPRLRRLTPVTSSLEFPFPADAPPVAPEAVPLSEQSLLLEPQLPSYSARYSPALPDAFRIADLAADAFIALPQGASQIAAVQRRLEGAPEYQVLWHRIWRQPLLPRSQVASVLVEGGDQEGSRHALEGSLRFSDNGAGIAQIDINVWLNIFNAALGEPAQAWRLPQLPAALRPQNLAADPQSVTGNAALPDKPNPALAQPLIEMVWQQETNRDIGPNQLYYLDHPVIGVLIQARPYTLPEIELTETAEDF